MPKRKRFKLLLDEMLPRRENFPVLNNYHNVRHIVHDLKQSGISDIDVIKIAKSQNRILVTKNIKHFREDCERFNVSLIGIAETMQPEDLDKKLVAILKKYVFGKLARFFKLTD